MNVRFSDARSGQPRAFLKPRLSSLGWLTEIDSFVWGKTSCRGSYGLFVDRELVFR